MSERLEGRDWEMTLAILAGVRHDLANGCDPEDEEPDDHKAVRLIEDEAVRARLAEAAQAGRIVALESEADILRSESAHLRERIADLEARLAEVVERHTQ